MSSASEIVRNDRTCKIAIKIMSNTNNGLNDEFELRKKK